MHSYIDIFLVCSREVCQVYTRRIKVVHDATG